jgi:hypothetical protein
LLGRIVARDLGDSRLTNHYYTFFGTPGDLLITIQSRNLNGDLDVFAANGLRPLLKLSLYAESTSPVTKGIYLRRREQLILRIEARSPNDDEGTYQLFFGGSFEPIVGGPETAEAETPEGSPTTSSDGKTKRVSSVGARLPEPDPPVTEVASNPAVTPEPTPEAKPTESPSPEKATEEPPKSTSTRTSPRGRRPAPRRTTAPTVVKPTETSGESVKKEEETPVEEPPAKPKPTPRSSTRTTGRSTRSTRPTTEAESVPAEPPVESGPRLVIETNDGTLINRSMSTVRRVTVENGQVVVTGKDGKVDRILLANVVRMSISP